MTHSFEPARQAFAGIVDEVASVGWLAEKKVPENFVLVTNTYIVVTT